jgi:hypothetical protein
LIDATSDGHRAQIIPIGGAARWQSLELVEAGTIEKVLVHEVSRLARRNSVAHEFIEFLEAHGVSLYWHSQAIETLPEPKGDHLRELDQGYDFPPFQAGVLHCAFTL